MTTRNARGTPKSLAHWDEVGRADWHCDDGSDYHAVNVASICDICRTDLCGRDDRRRSAGRLGVRGTRSVTAPFERHTSIRSRKERMRGFAESNR